MMRWLVFVLFLLIFTSLAGNVKAEGVYVVVHISNQHDEYSIVKLRSIFLLRRKYWENGEPALIVMMEKGNPDNALFSGEILNMNWNFLRLSQKQRMYSGKGSTIIRVKSAKEAIDVVAKTPGAITYIPDEYSLINPQVKKLNLIREK